jgi:hypothetical protein
VRDETADWLNPMLEAAKECGVDVLPLFMSSSMPAAEADTPITDWLAKKVPDSQGLDWVRFGQFLRHELGWDDTYPAFPDYPGIRDN